MIDKAGVLVVFLVLWSFLSVVLYSFVVSAQENPVVEKVEKTREFVEEQKWKYLSEEWKRMLLKNPLIAVFDALFRKLDIVFLVLIGEHYDLTLTLFIAVLIALFFYVQFYAIVRGFSMFSGGASALIALALVTVNAQLRLYTFLATALFKIIFSQEGVWSWIGFFLFFIFYIFLLFYLNALLGALGKDFKKRREQMKKAQEKAEQELLNIRMKGMEKALGHVEKGLGG